jgi:hypothetical protein
VKLGTNQSISVWFYDKRLGEDNRHVNEIQMIDLFEMYKPEMYCRVIVAVLDNGQRDENEFDCLQPLCVLPCIEVSPPKIASGAQSHPQIDEGVSASKATAKEADASEPGIFDHEEEYVGVHDEHFYISVPPPQANNAQPDAYELEHVADKNIHPDIEVDDADPEEINVLHDPENPNIALHALFPDIITFRKAVRHHAIVKGFEFAGLQIDKTRFIAKCSHEGCPWCIHASRVLRDSPTIQVQDVWLVFFMFVIYALICILTLFIGCLQIKRLTAKHNCPSTKLREGKMPTQGWVADRLAEWLKKNPEKGAKEAKEKVESDYGIKLKYSKAWSGMNLALQ